MSGRDAAASRRNSPNSRWQRRTSSTDNSCCRAANNAGGVSRGSNLDDKSTRALRAEESFAWRNSIPSCAKDYSWSCDLPKRVSEKVSDLERTSCSPHPKISAVRAGKAPAAPSSFRCANYKQGSEGDAPYCNPTLARSATCRRGIIQTIRWSI